MANWKKRRDILKAKNWDGLKNYAKDLGVYMYDLRPADESADKLIDKIIVAENNIHLSRT